MKLRLLSAADWLLLRLRYPISGAQDWTPDWMVEIHLIPWLPFEWLSRRIDNKIMDLEEVK